MMSGGGVQAPEIPSVVDGGLTPPAWVLAVAAGIIAVAALVVMVRVAIAVFRRSQQRLPDSKDASTSSSSSSSSSSSLCSEEGPESGGAPSSSSPTAFSSVSSLWRTRVRSLSVSVASTDLRLLRPGTVLCVVYALNLVQFWSLVVVSSASGTTDDGETLDAEDSAHVSEANSRTQEFAKQLMDPTNPGVFAVNSVLCVVFTAILLFAQFGLRVDKSMANHKVLQSEAYRMTVTIFVPTACIFFLHLVRALIYGCDPIEGAQICDAHRPYRLLLQPFVVLVESACAFKLWQLHAVYNRSAALALASTMCLVGYALSVCIFNAKVIITGAHGIDRGFFYIAICRAIVAEIWVFQFVRVGVDNMVLCLTQAWNERLGAADAGDGTAAVSAGAGVGNSSFVHVQAAPGQLPLLASGGSAPSAVSGTDAALYSSQGVVALLSASDDRVAADTPCAPLSNAGVESPENRSPVPHVSPPTPPASAEAARGSTLLEYVALVLVFMVVELVALVVEHTSSPHPATVAFGSSIVQAVSWARLVFLLLFVLFVLWRVHVTRTFRVSCTLTYTAALVMHCFALVILVSLSIVETQNEVSHWPALVMTVRFPIIALLLLLAPPEQERHFPRDVWLLFAFALFLWTAVAVGLQLVMEGYAVVHNNVAILRGVFTESLQFEILSLAIDRYYHTPSLSRTASVELGPGSPQGPVAGARKTCARSTQTGLRQWVIAAGPALLASASIASRLAIFGGAFDPPPTSTSSTSASDHSSPFVFLAPDLLSPYVVAGCICQVVASVGVLLVLRGGCGARFVRGAHTGSYVAAHLFVSFGLLATFVLLPFARPATALNVTAAMLQPLADMALVVGSIGVWSARGKADPAPGSGVWRGVGLALQVGLLAVHCAMGIAAAWRLQHGAGEFTLFYLLRWCCVAFALYEVALYALFSVTAPDAIPLQAVRREHKLLIPFYGGLTVLVLAPIIGSVGRLYGGADDDAGLRPSDYLAFAATLLELSAYIGAFVAYWWLSRGRSFGAEVRHSLLHHRSVARQWLCLVAVYVAYQALNEYVHVFGSASGGVRPWNQLSVANDMLRGLMEWAFFLHFVPHHGMQTRARAVAQSATYLVCSTRLLTYGLRLVQAADEAHPRFMTAVALLDSLLTLHVTAVGLAHYPVVAPMSGRATTHAAGVSSLDGMAPLTSGSLSPEVSSAISSPTVPSQQEMATVTMPTLSTDEGIGEPLLLLPSAAAR